jgi:hypothetical protein
MAGVETTGRVATMGGGETMGRTGNNSSFRGVGTDGSAATDIAVVGVARVAVMVGAAFTGVGVRRGV